MINNFNKTTEGFHPIVKGLIALVCTTIAIAALALLFALVFSGAEPKLMI